MGCNKEIWTRNGRSIKVFTVCGKAYTDQMDDDNNNELISAAESGVPALRAHLKYLVDKEQGDVHFKFWDSGIGALVQHAGFFLNKTGTESTMVNFKRNTKDQIIFTVRNIPKEISELVSEASKEAKFVIWPQSGSERNEIRTRINNITTNWADNEKTKHVKTYKAFLVGGGWYHRRAVATRKQLELTVAWNVALKQL
jgi:hypothetical protein